MKPTLLPLSCALVFLALPLTPASAQTAAAAAPIVLSVDATDLDHRVLRAVEDIPVTQGSMSLLYPEWLPGTHSPAYSALRSLSGVEFSANGQPIAWTRDPVEMSRFHLDIPAGVSHVTARLTFLTPFKSEGDNDRVTMSQNIVSFSWHSVVLYPAGAPVDQIPVEANLKLPQGWQFGTALTSARTEGATTFFQRTDLGTLVDSPVLAGRYFKKVDLDPGAAVRVSLDVAADRPEDLDISPEALNAHRALITQAMKLYQSHHYDHYDFLLSLSATVGGIGLEHHQSSEDGVDENYFTEWKETWDQHDLLPHEYTHSWNGKFRRPADLTTPNYNVPMQDSLLWVYEGQTQFWGKVLTVRAGMRTQEQEREEIADLAARFENLPGREWRNLQDTTNQEIISQHGHSAWPTWTREADYYDEMVLVWLDVDARIRQASHGQRSLQDFARLFFGVDNGSHVIRTYTFDDVVAALNQVQPADWRSFLRERLDSHSGEELEAGLERSGWKLVFSDTPNESIATVDKDWHETSFQYSIGLDVSEDDLLRNVVWGGPAYAAGLAPGFKLIAVNGRAYDKDGLRDAIVAAKNTTAPIELLIRDGEMYRTVKIDYHGGLRQPHLERIAGTPDDLDKLLSPL